jgi:glycosyltransferase involved in cell wall biosynthesis
LLVADDPEGFAAAVVDILKNNELAAHLSKNGLEFVSKYFTLGSAIEKIEALYREITSV